MYRLGIDLVDVRRIERLIQRFGSVFLDRVFSLDEQSSLAGSGKGSGKNVAVSLAARFAAKEAVFKASSGDFGHGTFRWKSVEILRNPSGRPFLRFDDALAPFLGQDFWDISMTHEYPYAQAIVMRCLKGK
jgi:holo-[acyl-carrier protein] synthase